MTDIFHFCFRKQRSRINAISKITTKILGGFRRKEKREAIFFNIEKAYDKNNREKILEQLENMGTQRRIMEFIRQLIGERWIHREGAKCNPFPSGNQ